MISLNLRAHFQLIKGVARHLVERGAPGAIACAGSLNAYGGQPDLCAYSAAKGGLLTLVRHAAHALLPHQIRVNIVNFGWMHTQGEIEIQASVHGHDEAWLHQAASELPFGRLIRPSEAAHLLTYLLTDDSAVMTGAAIDSEPDRAGTDRHQNCHSRCHCGHYGQQRDRTQWYDYLRTPWSDHMRHDGSH